MNTIITYNVEVLDKKTNQWEYHRCGLSTIEKAEQVLEKLMADLHKSIVSYDPWTEVRIVEVKTSHELIKEVNNPCYDWKQ